jgi:hypothetical protein
MNMDIETYQDRVYDRLQKAGVTDEQLNGMLVGTLVSHCFMKGVTVAKAAPAILARLRGED